MNPDQPIKSSHPDELLPWYVNQTLSSQEQLDVEEHIRDCTRCQQEISLLQRMREQVQAAPLESPGDLGLQRLLAEIKKDKDAAQGQHVIQPQTWWKTFAIAASLIIAVQAGLLLDAYFFSTPIVPLSGPAREGIVLQISFLPTATEEEIRETLQAIAGTVVDGPGQFGIYRIRLHLQPTQQQEIEKAVEFLQQQTTVIEHAAKE